MRASRLRQTAPTTLLALLLAALPAAGRDLPEIQKAGVLRHLGIPYANFVSGAGDGMDVEMMQLFCKQIGVKYEYVKTDWGTVVEDLIGKKVKAVGDNVEFGAADLGVSGRDVLEERRYELYQPVDLELARCRMVVAAPIDRGPIPDVPRVATKYPRIAAAHFARKGVQAEIIYVGGSVAGAIAGLALALWVMRTALA